MKQCNHWVLDVQHYWKTFAIIEMNCWAVISCGAVVVLNFESVEKLKCDHLNERRLSRVGFMQYYAGQGGSNF